MSFCLFPFSHFNVLLHISGSSPFRLAVCSDCVQWKALKGHKEKYHLPQSLRRGPFELRLIPPAKRYWAWIDNARVLCVFSLYFPLHSFSFQGCIVGHYSIFIAAWVISKMLWKRNSIFQKGYSLKAPRIHTSIFFTDYWDSKLNIGNNQRNSTLPHYDLLIFLFLKCLELWRLKGFYFFKNISSLLLFFT